MFNLLLAATFCIWNLYAWHAVPAIVAISLVYSATRHERLRPILVHAVRSVFLIICFMALVFAALEAINWFI